MSPVSRRVTPAAPASGGSVNFGGAGFFTGGMGLPEGNYAATFSTQVFQPTKADGTASRTPAFLAVMGTFYPIDPATGELRGEIEEHPFNCGPNALESFVPSADGKGFDAIPNGKSQGMWNLSAFGVFLDSLKACGLPPSYVSNDFSVLDGIWIHTQNIPEPDEKRAYGQRARAKTGAAAMSGQGADDQDRVRLNVICTEILEGGKPWEGTGGIPDESEAAAPKVASRIAPRAAAPVARPASRIAPRVPPPAAAPQSEEMSEEDINNAAINAASESLGKNPNGMTTAALKVAIFQFCAKEYGDDVAQAVQNTWVQPMDAFKALLQQNGYVVSGVSVKRA